MSARAQEERPGSRARAAAGGRRGRLYNAGTGVQLVERTILSHTTLRRLSRTVQQAQVGNCGVECKTVERAAEQIMGEHDTDIAEVLFTVGGASQRMHVDSTQGSGRSLRVSPLQPPLPALPPVPPAGQEDARPVQQLAVLRAVRGVPVQAASTAKGAQLDTAACALRWPATRSLQTPLAACWLPYSIQPGSSPGLALRGSQPHIKHAGCFFFMLRHVKT